VTDEVSFSVNSLDKICLFGPKIGENFGQMCFTSANSTNFANFLAKLCQIRYHKTEK
jgi:hypothetical protein